MDSSRQDHQNMQPQIVQQRTANESSPRPSTGTSSTPSATSHSNEKTGVYDHSSELESQPAIHSVSSEVEVPPATDETNETPQRLSQIISRVRFSTWWLIGAILIAIPLSLFATVLKTANIDGIRVMGIVIWLEIIWTAGWLIHLSVWLIGKGWQRLCQHGLDDWDDLFITTATSQLSFVLALVAWGSCSIMCSSSHGTCNVHWFHMLRKVLLATIPATGLFLIKDFLLEVIIVRQAARMFEVKRNLVLRHARAFRLILSMIESMVQDMVQEEEPQKTYLQMAKLWLQNAKDLWCHVNSEIFLRKRSPAAEDYHSLEPRYILGDGRDEDFDMGNKTFADRMRDEYREMYEILLYDHEGNIQEHVSEEFFREKLNIPHTKKINNSSFMGGTPLTAKEMLAMLDKDGDNKIRLEEWVEAHVETMMAVRDVHKSVIGITRAAKSVDVVISCLLLCVVAILYAAFFANHLGSTLAPIWATFTGLSFALAGTVTEFIAACGFVFSKQPYDIGDRVMIEDKDLIVDRVCLYTIFHRASDGAIEQIAHKKIADSWITNLSRSRGLSVKESANISGGYRSDPQVDTGSLPYSLEGVHRNQPGSLKIPGREQSSDLAAVRQG